MISVIVPVYNVEAYLPRCIESILAQLYKDFELLLVDDGSKDSSGAICDEYAKKDRRIKAFHKENGGVSDARNYGLDHAIGDYICFVDSDDYVGQDYLSIMFNMITQNEADLAMVSYTVVFDEEPEYVPSKDIRCVMSGASAYTKMLIGNEFGWQPIAKLFRKKIAKDMRFPVGYIYDDFYTIPYIFDKCSICVHSQSIQYYYYQRVQSLTHVISTERFEMWELGIDKLLEYTKRKHANCIRTMEKLLIKGLINYTDRLLDSHDYLTIAHHCRSKYALLLRKAMLCRDLGIRRRFACFLLYNDPKLYRQIKRMWLPIKHDSKDKQNRSLMKIE